MPYNEKEIPEFINMEKICRRNKVYRYITDNRPDISVLPGIDTSKMPVRVPCKQIFRDIVIRANGDVTPCVITAESPTIIVWATFLEMVE